MIIGIGSDLCDIRRIEETLGKFGDRFVARCFTEVNGADPTGAPAAPPRTPSGSRPRRPAPRRSARG